MFRSRYLRIAVTIVVALAACDEGLRPQVTQNELLALVMSAPVSLDPLAAETLVVRGRHRNGQLVPVTELQWESSRTEVLEISSAGVATARSAGTADITVTHASGLFATARIEVLAAPLIVSLGFEHDSVLLPLRVGQDTVVHLVATGRKGPVEVQDITWSTSNDLVATVHEGSITAISPGQARITAVTPTGIRAQQVVEVADGTVPVAISLLFSDSVPRENRYAIELAARRWQRVFSSGLTPVVLNGDLESDCPPLANTGYWPGTNSVWIGNPPAAGVETGLRIFVFSTPAIPNGTGGVCKFRDNGVPAVSYLGFHHARWAGQPLAVSVEFALHELGHALGLVGNTPSAYRNLQSTEGTGWWSGPEARAGFQLEFGEARDSLLFQLFHWGERELRSESTTDAIANGPIMTRRRITAVSIGMLRDLGYPANFNRRELVAPDPCAECPGYFPPPPG